MCKILVNARLKLHLPSDIVPKKSYLKVPGGLSQLGHFPVYCPLMGGYVDLEMGERPLTRGAR